MTAYCAEVPSIKDVHQLHCSSYLQSIFLSEQTCTILNFLDGTLRFAESVALLYICFGVSSYMWVVLLKAEHANAMVFAEVTILSLMSTRPMAKLCLLCAWNHNHNAMSSLTPPLRTCEISPMVVTVISPGHLWAVHTVWVIEERPLYSFYLDKLSQY